MRRTVFLASSTAKALVGIDVEDTKSFNRFLGVLLTTPAWHPGTKSDTPDHLLCIGCCLYRSQLKLSRYCITDNLCMFFVLMVPRSNFNKRTPKKCKTSTKADTSAMKRTPNIRPHTADTSPSRLTVAIRHLRRLDIDAGRRRTRQIRRFAGREVFHIPSSSFRYIFLLKNASWDTKPNLENLGMQTFL